MSGSRKIITDHLLAGPACQAFIRQAGRQLWQLIIRCAG